MNFILIPDHMFGHLWPFKNVKHLGCFSGFPIRIGLGLLEQRCPDAVPCDAHDELLDAVPWAFASGVVGVWG